MYPIPLRDVLEIRPNSGSKTNFIQTGLDLGMGKTEDNLVMKAYHLVKMNFPSMPNLDIHLHKVIPSQAGLGGGSSDAAYALRLMNRVLALNLSDEQLFGYASQIGSDCPFFLQDEPKYVTGCGNIFNDTDVNLSGWWLSLVKSPQGISTKEAYANVIPRLSRVRYDKMYDIKWWRPRLRNDFELYAFRKYPLLKRYKELLYAKGAKFASMSGSGTCLYALSEEKLDLADFKHYRNTFLWQHKLR
jgi:4-diphosphocytidyl-2-C-methyl-D-erythritol kinase